MTRHNGKVLKVERGSSGVPHIHHLEMQRACNKFLESRGIFTQSTFRKSAWLYGRVTPEKHAA